ncbi:MAG: tetratricopeptide repeat protein [Acidiferrobacterales bacterium]
MSFIVDKFSRHHRLVSPQSDADLEAWISAAAQQLFGNRALYVGAKNRVEGPGVLGIASGYVIDTSEAGTPRLLVIKAAVAENGRADNVGAQLFKLVTSFGAHQVALRNFLHAQLSLDARRLAQLEAESRAAGYANVDDFLDTAVGDEFRGAVVTDEIHQDLNLALSKINARIALLELKTFEAEDGSRLYQVEALRNGDSVSANMPTPESDAKVTIAEQDVELAPSTPTLEPLTAGAAPAGDNGSEKATRRGLNEDQKMVAQVNQMAAFNRAQGRPQQAKPLLKRALRIQEKILGPEHVELATTLNHLALCYRALGEPRKAKTLLKRALQIQRRTLGDEQLELADTLDRLALCYIEEEQHDKARALLKWATRIQLATLGPHHSDLACSLERLARVYQALGKHRKAEDRYRRALAIWEKSLGKRHPNVARALESYASLLSAIGRSAEATAMAIRARAIRTTAENSAGVARGRDEDMGMDGLQPPAQR